MCPLTSKDGIPRLLLKKKSLLVKFPHSYLINQFMKKKKKTSKKRGALETDRTWV